MLLQLRPLTKMICSLQTADGQSGDRVSGPSTALKDAGVIVYTVGIGSVNVNELRLISSDPDDEHVFLLSSFRDAAGFVDFLSVTTCESEYVYTVHAIAKWICQC